MNAKHTLTIGSALALLLAPACTQEPVAAAPAAGSIVNTVPSTAIDSAKTQDILDHKAPIEVKADPNVKKIEPVPTQPEPIRVPPGSMGGVRFGAKHRAGRTVIRLA